MNEIKIFCPATIANLNCGFDVLGLCLEGIGDEMIIRKSTEKGIKITKITGADLPFETEKNVAGVAALAICKEASKPITTTNNAPINPGQLVTACVPACCITESLNRFVSIRVAEGFLAR